MAATRRQFLSAAGFAGLAGAGFSLAGCAPGTSSNNSGGSGGGGSAGSSELTVAWWGNPTRNENTTKMIAAYKAATSGLSVDEQPGEWQSYWDKIATQVAGGTAPDLIQMDMAYISEYGGRGALLDLSQYGLDTSKFSDGTVESGEVGGTLVGANAGINTPTIAANPALFEQAGIALPDDTTWTWDDLKALSIELAGKTGGIGLADLFRYSGWMAAMLRQNGKELWTEDGMGFGVDDVTEYFEMMVDWQKAGAIPDASSISEESSKALDQSSFATGAAALSGAINSNQLSAINDASGQSMKLLRWPSFAGKAAERKAWYKASMLWSASAKTADPEGAVAMINFFLNSTESNDIELAERGIPANTEVLAEITPKLSPAQQEVAAFLTAIEPELGDNPVAPPPGGGTMDAVMLRYETEVQFGRLSTADAAQGFVDEVQSNLTA